MKERLKLTELEISEIPRVVDIIKNVMNSDEGEWAEKTINRHFKLSNHSINDGRYYYVAKNSGKLIGIVGLHHYEWGPPDKVWLAWFAVDSQYQNLGVGTFMLKKIEKQAIKLGYKHLLIETYTSNDFKSAREFYTKREYIPSGIIADYISSGIDMIVYSKKL